MIYFYTIMFIFGIIGGIVSSYDMSVYVEQNNTGGVIASIYWLTLMMFLTFISLFVILTTLVS